MRRAPAGSTESRALNEKPPWVAGPGRGQPRLGPQVALGRLNLDVLVYAEAAAQRMVFINRRRYVEGDRIAGIGRIEAIIPEEAMLVYEGQRLLLHPKANFYLPPVK